MLKNEIEKKKMDTIEVKNIPIEYLKPGKFQTRRDFNPEALKELAESIKSEGLIQPIIVRPIKSDNNVNSEIGEYKSEEKGKQSEYEKHKRYEIVAGERRWRASQLARLETIPCLINDYNDKQIAAITPIENIQRENLNPIEEAFSYQHLIDEFGYTHDEVAIIVGRSRTKITNLLRLLRLDTRVQELLASGDINEGHGKIIAGLPYNLQYELAKKSSKHSWSLRKLDQEVKKLCKDPDKECKTEELSPAKNTSKSDPNILSLEKMISSQLGTEVKLEINSNKRESGWLKIKYFNNDILSGILDRLGIGYDR
jgi:ParB family transcriptional regulator, chromosome partitioning protein